jgi:Zn-finger nucleic acid-binding protein
MDDRQAQLHCPRCDWRFVTRNTISRIEYCPRCLARARRAVRLEGAARPERVAPVAAYRSAEDAAA